MKDVRQSRCEPSRPFCEDPSGVACYSALFLQDALSEVLKIYLPLKLRVFVDGITALVKERNKEMAEMAKKVMKKLKEEVEKEGLRLSVTENGRREKSKMIASCGFLEEELLNSLKKV